MLETLFSYCGNSKPVKLMARIDEAVDDQPDDKEIVGGSGAGTPTCTQGPLREKAIAPKKPASQSDRDLSLKVFDDWHIVSSQQRQSSGDDAML